MWWLIYVYSDLCTELINTIWLANLAKRAEVTVILPAGWQTLISVSDFITRQAVNHFVCLPEQYIYIVDLVVHEQNYDCSINISAMGQRYFRHATWYRLPVSDTDLGLFWEDTAVSNFDTDWRPIMENNFLRYFWLCSERRRVLSSMQRDFFAKSRTKCGWPASSHR